MRAFSIVEESSDLDAACEPPRGTAGQSFPVAVRKEVSSSPSSSSSSSVSFAGAIGDADAEADAARMFAAMSEKDILKAQEEITQLASSKTVDILKKRAARFANSNNSNTNINNINRASNSHVSVAPVVNAVSAPSGVVVKDAEVRELVLPPIEHEKLAWTDPETKQQPREKEEFAHSLRVQSFRFGLEGEIVPEDAANEHTYNSGLHHHGEDPDKPGYTLDELSTLMRSQNEPQNLFAAKLLLCLVQRIVTGDYTKELLYPESGARSMTVGEGILWEFLGMKMLVPLRICCFKRSPALRSTCVALVEALCVALADDEELGKQAHQPHWGNLVFPSAPLFEDDGSEEMEKLDGLRCMVRQLDFLPLFDPGTVMGLTCLAKIAGHSRTLALMISSHSELLDAIVTSGMLVAPAKALRLLRLLLSSDSRHVRSMEQKGVPASCWRFLLSPLDADTQQEALLLLRVMLLFGSQVSDLIHVLPDLVTRVLDGRMSPWRPCFLCDALVVAAPDIDHVVIESLLRACVSHCLTEMDAVAVIHLAASAARRWSGINIRSKISPLLIRLQNGSQSFWLATMRLANASSDVLAELPTWVWNTDCIVQAAASLCRPLAQADKVNRFQTQRRLRELVAHREGILLVREMLIAGVHSMGQADAVALFGLAFDMVSRLAIIGADEWLLFDLLERVLLNPLFLERVTCQLVPDESHNTAESLHQCKMLCSSLLEGVQGTFFADKDWLKRCRSVVGEGDANDVRPDGFFAGESLCMGSFVGADWLFRLCKSESGDTVRSAMQMLLLAELTKSTKSLSIMSNTSKLIKLCGLFGSPDRPFLHPAVASALRQLLVLYSKSIDGNAFGGGLDVDDLFNPMQAATDLVENFLSSGHNSAVFSEFVFFFMRSDLPYDFRLLVWNSVNMAWRLLKVDADAVQGLLHLYLDPPESNPKVIAAMESSLRQGSLTLAKNKLILWLAVHHLSLWAFGSKEDEWQRAQLLVRLKRSCLSVYELIIRYQYKPPVSKFPPEHISESAPIPEDRRVFIDEQVNNAE